MIVRKQIEDLDADMVARHPGRHQKHDRARFARHLHLMMVAHGHDALALEHRLDRFDEFREGQCLPGLRFIQYQHVTLQPPETVFTLTMGNRRVKSVFIGCEDALSLIAAYFLPGNPLFWAGRKKNDSFLKIPVDLKEWWDL